MTIPPQMKTATEWGSHLPALLACIAVTDGPVLELGMGHFSTPQLHALCVASGRFLVSIEQDTEWHEEFKKYAHEYYHEIRTGAYCALLDEAATDGLTDKWGVAFIDHSPGGANRANAFKQLIEVSDYVVMHDAQRDAENFKAVEPMLEGVNWYLCTGYFPHTLVCSKTRPIPEVLLGM